MQRLLALALLGFATVACSDTPPPSTAPPADVLVDTATAEHWIGRADISPSGNRVSTGRGDIRSVPVEFSLESAAVWLVPLAAERNAPWVAVLADGRLVELDLVGGEVVVLDDGWAGAEPHVIGGRVAAMAPEPIGDDALEPLFDARTVTDGDTTVTLVGPTGRYGHAVLGDGIEASGFLVAGRGGSSTLVDFDSDVIEGRSALLGDADGDGHAEILVTLSNGRSGARLVLYDTDGSLVAESEAIGRGNRWRNQLAIAPLGPDGEIEVVDVRTPHLGRTIEYFRLEGDQLVRVATQSGFTSHVLGSRNLELAIVADPDGDGALEVIAPTSDRLELGVVARTPEGTTIEHTVELGALLSSNVGAVDHPDGSASYAVGTRDGTLLFWPAS